MESENSLEVILYPGNQKNINKSSLFRNNSGPVLHDLMTIGAIICNYLRIIGGI
jgi:hypothetical protein